MADTLKNHEVAINLGLFKRYRFYNMFDPNGKRIFGRNVCRLSSVALTVVVLCLVVYGTLGFFTRMDDTLSNVDFLLVLVVNLQYYQCLLRTGICLRRAATIWDVFVVSKIRFFASRPCSRYLGLLHGYRDRITGITNLYSGFCLPVMFFWVMLPVAIGTLTGRAEHRRARNVMNLRFPVSTPAYNRYFFVFYGAETVIAIFIMYVLLMVDVFFVSFCWIIIAQNDVLSRSFESVGSEDKPQTEDYEDFKAILIDQQKLYSKTKSFYSVVRPVILTCVAIAFGSIVIVSYLFILGCTTVTSTADVVKLGFTALLLGVQIFLYCYLFDNIHSKKETVNFGMYSCEWTKMDLKFKKLLLMMMRMNDANPLAMKASPKNMINLQLFANVMITSYNMVSVMIKTMNKQNHLSELS